MSSASPNLKSRKKAKARANKDEDDSDAQKGGEKDDKNKPSFFCFKKQMKKLVDLIQQKNPNLFVTRSLKKQIYYQ